MAYWKKNSKNTRALDNFGLSTNQSIKSGNNDGEFYELEPGIVLDIVMDDTHPIFSKGESAHSKIDAERWPADLNNNPSLKTDIDYTWIGRALVRPIISEKLTDKDQLMWAYPLESNISEYPLINEIVILISQNEKLYYTRKLNYHNWTNNNLNFSIENSISGKQNNTLFSDNILSGKRESKTSYNGDVGQHGYAGQYFVANNNIRTVKRFEGDLLFESRHGQTIHLTAYDKNRSNDIGDPKYSDYLNGGNPMILIRNRQRPLVKEGQKLFPHKKLPPIIGTKQEKNVGGYLEEDINHDGTSIHITSGQTISGYVTTCYKKMFGTGEETAAFEPLGATSFKYPILNGDQIVINSDRIILSSRYGETFHFSKKRYGIVTDSEYTVDAHDQIVMTTHVKTVFNSPVIYLGEYNQTSEPMLLGQTTISWLYALCTWLETHIHIYKHSHTNAGKESPSTTQTPPTEQEIILGALKNNLQSLLSRRVFVTGGGYAPGHDGSSIG